MKRLIILFSLLLLAACGQEVHVCWDGSQVTNPSECPAEPEPEPVEVAPETEPEPVKEAATLKYRLTDQELPSNWNVGDKIEKDPATISQTYKDLGWQEGYTFEYERDDFVLEHSVSIYDTDAMVQVLFKAKAGARYGYFYAWPELHGKQQKSQVSNYYYEEDDPIEIGDRSVLYNVRDFEGILQGYELWYYKDNVWSQISVHGFKFDREEFLDLAERIDKKIK